MSKRPASERFWEKVLKTDSCWLWQASLLMSGGYGQFTDENGRQVRAHRWAYEQLVGPIPAGIVLDHLCRTPACVNPDHLEPVTPAENTYRAPFAAHSVVNSDICRSGHRRSVTGTYRSPEGKDYCRQCMREQLRRSRARRTVADLFPCAGTCGRMIRPAGLPARAAPGTVGVKGQRMCDTCHARYARRASA